MAAEEAAAAAGGDLDWDAVWAAVNGSGLGTVVNDGDSVKPSERAVRVSGDGDTAARVARIREAGPPRQRHAELDTESARERYGASLHGDAYLVVDVYKCGAASGGGAKDGDAKDGAPEEAGWSTLEEAAAHALLLWACQHDDGGFQHEVDASPWKGGMDWESLAERFSWDCEELAPGIVRDADRAVPPARIAMLDDDGNHRTIVAQSGADKGVFYHFEFSYS